MRFSLGLVTMGLLAAACSTAGPAATSSTSSSASSTPSTPSSTSSTTTADPFPSGVVEIEVEVEGGEVEGRERVEIPNGLPVLIIVTADVTDEVHVHGYDLTAEVTPEQPAVIQFIADVPGVFEVELEGAHLLLATLEVGA